MSARRDRMARVTKAAAETEELARARLAEARRQVDGVDRERESALDSAARLAEEDVPLRLRSHLTGAGARLLGTLADRKTGLVEEAESRRAELQEAATRVKSLERLVDRLDAEVLDRRHRSELADLQDLVAIRAARAATDDHSHRAIGGRP